MITPIQKNINIDPIKVPKKTQSFQGATKIGEEAADTFKKAAENLKDAKIFDNIRDYLTRGFDAIKNGLKVAKDFVVEYAKKGFEFVSKKFNDFKDISKNSGSKSKTMRNTIIAGTTAGGVIGASGIAIHRRKGKEDKE